MNSNNLPPIPGPARSSFGAVMHDGKYYIAGGHINQTHHYPPQNYTNRLDCFDIASNSWFPTLAPRPLASQGFFLVAYGNYLYALGGDHHYGFYPPPYNVPEWTYQSTDIIHRYDIQNNTWETVGRLPRPRSSYIAGVVDDVVYLIGGWNGNPTITHAPDPRHNVGGIFLEQIDTFDLRTESVGTLTTTLPNPLRRALASVIINDQIILIGGITNTTDPATMTVNKVTVFAPKSPTQWSEWQELPYGIFAPGTALDEETDEIYSFGGYIGLPQPLNFTKWVFSLSANRKQWSQRKSMSEDRGFVQPVPLAPGKFGLLGGALDPAQSGQQSNAFDLYTTSYQGILVRDTFSDAGKIPSGVDNFWSSPDIIPRTAKVSDPQNFFTNNYNWWSDLGQNPIENQKNYIYVRGENLAPEGTQAQIYVYYCTSELLLHPEKWKDNLLKTESGIEYTTITASQSKEKVVCDNPLILEPKDTEHHCLIVRVSTAENPNPVPTNIKDMNDLATYVTEHPNVAQRNIVIQDIFLSEWTQNVGYYHGEMEAEIEFRLVCNNMPIGTEVQLSQVEPTSEPIISMPTTKVTQSNNFTIGMVVKVPAHFEGKLTYSYWSNGQQPQPGANIDLQVLYVVPSHNPLYSRCSTPISWDVAAKGDYNFGDKKVLAVGGHRTVFQK